MRLLRQRQRPVFFATFAAFLLLLPHHLSGAIRLPKMLTSHAVLQRDQPIHLWGWSEPDERITASLNGASATTSGDRLGHWSLYLPPQHSGGPYSLSVSGSNKIVLEDVLIGDVWFASGQSNMEMPLSGFPGSAVVKNSAEEIQNANQPNIRLLFIPHQATSYPLGDFKGEVEWTQCNPETAAKFSAVAYFFAREIASKEHVPIGVIDSSWGGTPAEAWISLDSLSADASLMPVFASWSSMADKESDNEAAIAAEKREDEAAKQAHTAAPKHSWHPEPASWDPSWLFNAMVAPATPFGIRGVIWYQGESNSRREMAPLYQKVFATLINDWRRQWRQGNFPFLFTQISSFESGPNEDWPAVREAQLHTLSLRETGMAVTIDIGDPDNVHPADKQTVGLRLALAARALAYKEPVEFSGPLFRQSSTEGESSLRAWFDHADGLWAKGGTIQGFEIAGDDHRFATAQGRIDGTSVVLDNPEIRRPKYVRYGWANVPSVNLYNQAGLAASPFSSE